MAGASIVFRDLALIFIAALVGGAIAARLRQPLILGYVLGGIVISRFTPGPSVSDLHSMELFAEIGVILLMFSIGIEFSFRDLVRVKWVALVGGPLGIFASMALGALIARPLRWSTTQGMVIGSVVSVASTMVLARMLMDRGELRSEHGRVMVGITLMEDVAVVLLTVLLPTFNELSWDRIATVGIALGKGLLVLAPVAFAAVKIVPPLLRRVAGLHSQELFVIVTLALCLGTAAITQAIGLSLALGAFMAGLIISGSDYAREALGQLLPLRDAFVALFFVTIGLLIDPMAIFSDPVLLLVIILFTVVGKAVIWTGVVRVFRYPMETALLAALGLTQIGEFSFILVQVARNSQLVGADVYNATLAASLITILMNAVIFRKGSDWIRARQLRSSAAGLQTETDELHGHAVICGFGRIGGPAGTAFAAFGIPYVVLEIDPVIVHDAREKGIRCIFGDPVHLPVLEAAHVADAALVLVTLPEAERAYLAIRNIRRLNGSIPIIARAHRRTDYESLLAAGATRVVQPEVEASANFIASALEELGQPRQRISSYVDQYREAMQLAHSRPFGGPNPMPELEEVEAELLAKVGESLQSSGIRERLGLTVLQITRASGETVFNPAADTKLLAGDRLRVLGLPEQLERLRSA